MCTQNTGESAWRFKGGGHAVAGALGCTRRLKKGQKRQARGHAEQASGSVFPSFFPDWAFQYSVFGRGVGDSVAWDSKTGVVTPIRPGFLSGEKGVLVLMRAGIPDFQAIRSRGIQTSWF